MLTEPQWRQAEAAHEAAVDRLVGGYLERRRRGRAHPVEDFLFSYYSLRPGQLRRWHPGAGVVLTGAGARRWLERRGYVEVTTEQGPGVALDLPGFLTRRGGTVRFVAELLAATASRPARFGCFGMHEWAMVHRCTPEELRHAGHPLRLGREGTDRVVAERVAGGQRLRCTHPDAFRFFTAAARPLNQRQLQREDQLTTEQPGCLHATMDLYKWAYKLLPAVPGALVLDAFRLARQAREVDMRAAPYDLSDLGYRAIPVETEAGRAEYQRLQRELAERGAELRTRLADACAGLLAGWATADDPAPGIPPEV